MLQPQFITYEITSIYATFFVAAMMFGAAALYGKVTKKVTQSQLDRIVEEYNKGRREYQAEITQNENGTYNLPMNFPIGIADIEYYRDLSGFPGGKEDIILK